MPDTHTALQFLATYGYPGLYAVLAVATLGIGIPVPVTALVLTLGALSGAPDGPALLPLAAAGILGATTGHSGDYWFGRLGHTRVDRWLARVRRNATVAALLHGSERMRGGRALLLFLTRFLLTPIASPVSVLSGATGMRYRPYLVIELAGSAVYIVGNLTLGRIFGQGLLTNGAALPAFWLAVASVTLLPLTLMRLAPRLLNRVHPTATPATTE